MNTDHITRILLIGLGVYVIGLLLFLTGTGTDVDRDDRDHVIEADDKTLFLQRKKKEDDNRLYRLKQEGNGTNTEGLNADIRKGGKKRKKLQNIIKKYEDKNKIGNKFPVGNDFLNLQNLTFEQKADIILKMFQDANKPSKLNKKPKPSTRQRATRGTKWMSVTYTPEKSIHSHSKNPNATLNKTNSGFFQISEDVFLFSSFYDNRKSTPFIRNVLIAKSSHKINDQLWCHFRNLENRKLEGSKIEFYETCENHLKLFAAYIGSCKVPLNVEHDELFISNSEFEPEQGELKAIPIIHQFSFSYKNDLALCVPPLFGSVNSLRLIEFIEFSSILGFKHFTFYSHNVSTEIVRILQHYQRTGLVTLIQWPLPVSEDTIWYHGQSASVWDCLYRNMHVFKHVAFTDIDELIFPQNYDSLSEFIERESETFYSDNSEGNEISAFRFKSAYYDPLDHIMISNIFDLADNVENYLVTLNSVSRKNDFSAVRTKMIVDPIKIFEIGIHHVSKPMEENYQVINVDPSSGFIHHYRKCENNYGVRCIGEVADDRSRRYIHRLLVRMKWRFYYLFKEVLID